jgi:(2Fe-2S) ferredoxin
LARDVIWGHLRNEQARLGLREAGEGTMSARTSCLGPCSLAPVLQVWPEGAVYGGVDETGVDAIIAEHLLGGRIVTRLAYAPNGRKQILRKAQPAVDDAIDGLSQPATLGGDHGSSETNRS